MPARGAWRKSGREKPNSESAGGSAGDRKPSFWKLPEALPIWGEGSNRKLSASAEEAVIGEEDGLMKAGRSSLALAIHTGMSTEMERETGERGERGRLLPSFCLVASTHTGTGMGSASHGLDSEYFSHVARWGRTYFGFWCPCFWLLPLPFLFISLLDL